MRCSHTMGHICFLCKAPGAEDLIFTGDTLFVAGCGRCGPLRGATFDARCTGPMTKSVCRNFEGKPQNMYNSLIGKLKGLPPKTQVYCGHNYTRSNLAFAQHVGTLLDLRFCRSRCARRPPRFTTLAHTEPFLQTLTTQPSSKRLLGPRRGTTRDYLQSHPASG